MNEIPTKGSVFKGREDARGCGGRAWETFEKVSQTLQNFQKCVSDITFLDLVYCETL